MTRRKHDLHDLLRTRWAAVGAAVAVTLGAGGVSLTHAARTESPKPVFVSLDAPCRLVDTRTDTNVGPKSTVLAAGETNAYEIQVTGENGNCTDELAIPLDATGVALNVTAIPRSAPVTGRSYFTVYPADAARPLTSNLNFLADDPPMPNKVDVGLSADGRIRIFNNEGEADVAVDVFGYYVDHVHTGADIVDGSLTGADIEDGSITADDIAPGALTDDELADGAVTSAKLADEPGVVSSYTSDPVPLGGTPTDVASTTIRVPADGVVEVHVTASWIGDSGDVDSAICQLQLGAVSAIDTSAPSFQLSEHNAATEGYQVFSAHRVLPITVAGNPTDASLGQPLRLVCVETDAEVILDDVHISAAYFATSYAPAP